MKLILYISLLVLLLSVGSSSSIRTIPHKYLDNDFTSKLLNESLLVINKHFNSPNGVVLHDVLKFTSQVFRGVTYRLDLAVTAASCEHDSLSSQKYSTFPPTLGECRFSNDPVMWNVSVEVFYPREGIFDVKIRHVTKDLSLFSSFPKHLKFLGFHEPNLMHDLFAYFQTAYKKGYTGAEYDRRLKIFTYNMLKANLHQKMDKGSAKHGMTRFSDLTADEFKWLYTGLSYKDRAKSGTTTKNPSTLVSAPSSFDWRKKGAVTKVKDQSMCGSCWAFAATGNIEGQWFKKTGKLIPLSEQELLDCDTKDQACNGGLPEWAYESIIKMGGLMSEEAYPYEARKEKECKLKRSGLVAYINDSMTLSSDEKQMATWLAENGPISVGVNANFLQFYLGGISHPPHILCSKEGLDHAVLIVGYGVSTFLRRPYWIVKNSWGGGWGEEGYFRMYRGDGTCGINADPTSSIIK